MIVCNKIIFWYNKFYYLIKEKPTHLLLAASFAAASAAAALAGGFASGFLAL